MTNKYRVYKGFQKQKEKELFDNISDLKKKKRSFCCFYANSNVIFRW